MSGELITDTESEMRVAMAGNSGATPGHPDREPPLLPGTSESRTSAKLLDGLRRLGPDRRPRSAPLRHYRKGRLLSAWW